MNRVKKRKNSYTMPIILIIILLIALAIVGFKGYEVYEGMKYPDLVYELKDTQQFEYNEHVTVSDLVSSLANGTLTNGDEALTTGSLGIMSADIVFTNLKGELQNVTVKYEVVDTTAPVIESIDTITIYVNTELNLLDYVKVKDNYDESPTITIEGDFDNTTVGTYELSAKVTDSSNNTATKGFVVSVVKKDEPIDYTANYTETQLVDGTYTTSKGFTIEVIDHIAYIDGILIANKSYSLPSTYAPGFLEITDSAFKEMQSAAAELGLNLYNSSGYRSYKYQKQLYNNYCNRDGQAAADTYSARPGHSEHQTGYALDLNTITNSFKDTAEGQWIANHCYEYGFILRYPEGKSDETGYMYEPWHIRYVGVDLATKLYNGGDWLTLEDYFGIDSVYAD